MRSPMQFSFACAAAFVLCLAFSASQTALAQSAAANQYRFTTSNGAGIVPGTTAVTGYNCGVSPAGDDCVATIPLPFTYTFYASNYTSLVVSTNGNIQFESNNNDYGQFEVCFPLPLFRTSIVPYFADLAVSSAGEGIFTSVSGTAPNRIFNIEWRASTLGRPAGSLNFEVRLYEGQTRFDIIYGTVPSSGLDAAVGVQRVAASNAPAGAFTQYSCRTGDLRNGQMLVAEGENVNSLFLAGLATDTEGNPLPGVTVNLSGSSSATATTDADGHYLFDNLNSGGNHTVTAQQDGSTFLPASRTFTPYRSNQTVNFIRTVLPEAGQILISEFRFRGPSPGGGYEGLRDEFVELYNNTNTTFVVNTPDNSSGWALISSSTKAQQVRFVIPRGTTIPPRAHYLAGNNSGYGLFNLASTDVFFAGDIPDNSGIALVRTSNSANYEVPGNRLDAVGFTDESNAFFREAEGVPAINTDDGQYSFVRKLNNGRPQDTDVNANDFVLVSPNAASFGNTQSMLGTPGPENLASPVQHNARIKAAFIDPQCPGFGDPATACARVRIGTSVPNGQFGTLLLRRKFTNTTGQRLTRLRFRIVDLTTRGNLQPGQADLRLLTSSDRDVTTGNEQAVLLRGVTLNQSGSQPEGGGLNSTLSAGAVSLVQPLAPNATINIEFRLGVQQNGGFRFFVNIEAITAGVNAVVDVDSVNQTSTKGQATRSLRKR